MSGQHNRNDFVVKYKELIDFKARLFKQKLAKSGLAIEFDDYLQEVYLALLTRNYLDIDAAGIIYTVCKSVFYDLLRKKRDPVSRHDWLDEFSTDEADEYVVQKNSTIF